MSAAVQDPTLETPRLKLDQIRAHHANPRREAIADEAMVESIRRQGVLNPVMVAPSPDGDGWVLIDGHRRFDGAEKAGVSDVPVNARYDLVTEAQQIEVMAITGLQSEKLTPVEEAAAYEQLQLQGFDVDSIAASTGFTKARVRSRMKINGLTEKARDSIHDGQLTLADAETLLEFAGDPDATRELEAVIGTPNFRHQVHTIRGRIERSARNDTRVAELTAAGVPRMRTVPGAPGTLVPLDGGEEVRGTGLHMFPPGSDTTDPDTHAAAGCLVFYLPEYDYADVHVACIDPGSHETAADVRAEETRERQSEWEKQRAEREAAQARADAAASARLEWLVQHLTSAFGKSPNLERAAHAFLPLLIIDPAETVPFGKVELAYGLTQHRGYFDQIAALETVADEIAAGKQAGVLAAFGRWIAALVGDLLDTTPQDLETREEFLRHLAVWDWLDSTTYKLSDVDREQRASLETALAALAGDDQGDEDGDD